MDVSIIIVNYKTSHLIVDCIKSIRELTHGISYEVIIIDNNSEDDFELKIRRGASINKDNNYKFIGLPENIGFGRANNEGIKIAKGRNILFLNPDTVLLNNAIKILSDFLDQHPEAGGCGGNLIDENKKPTYSYRRILPGVFWEFNELMNNYPQKLIYGKLNHYYNPTSRPITVGFITGADLMVKKSVLEKTGYFRDEFFMYFEETDLCARIKKSGYRLYSVPTAIIQHLEGKSFDETRAFENDVKNNYMELSRSIYYNLNNDTFSKNLSNFLYYCFLRTRSILVKNPVKKKYYKKRLTFFLNLNPRT